MEEHTERVHRLESDVSALRVSNATLSASLDHLTQAVTTLTETVQVLRDTLNQGRGAMWLMMSLGAGLGGLCVVVLKKFF